MLVVYLFWRGKKNLNWIGIMKFVIIGGEKESVGWGMWCGCFLIILRGDVFCVKDVINNLCLYRIYCILYYMWVKY